MKKQNNNDSGIALLFTLILVVMFFVLGMAFMSRANFSAKMAKNLQESEEARIGANIALDHVKSIMVKNFSSNTSRPQVNDYGMTFPVWEAKRIDSNGTVHAGVNRNNDWAFRSYPVYNAVERALLSRRTILGEVFSDNARVDLYFNKYGNVVQVDSTASAYYNIIVDPTWAADASDPRRYGYRYAFVLLDKSSFFDINATRQEGFTGFPSADKPAKGVTYAEQNVVDSYANVDLSNVWPDCTHVPSTAPIYNFDELYGRTEVDGTVTLPSPPSLAGANPSPTDGGTVATEHHSARHDTRYLKDQNTFQGSYPGGNGGPDNPFYFTSDHYSFMHATAPYSVTETFPAYDASNNEYTVYDNGTTVIKKSHTRFDLQTIGSTAGKIDDLDDIIDGIEYLKRWKDADNTSLPTYYEDVRARSYTVAANIKDYIDSDLIPTFKNYTPMSGTTAGGVITPVPDLALGATASSSGDTNATICGNERVPALNEILFLKHRKANSDPYLCIKAELVWLYGQIPSSLATNFQNYEVKARIKIQYDENPWDATAFSGTAQTGVVKTVNLILAPDDVLTNNTYPNESDNYYVSKTAFVNIRTPTTDSGTDINSIPYSGNTSVSFRCTNFKVLEANFELLIDVGSGKEVVDIASLTHPNGDDIGTIANDTNTGVRNHFFTYAVADPRNNTHRITKRYSHAVNTFESITNWKAGTALYSTANTSKNDAWGPDTSYKNKYFPDKPDLASFGAANYWNLKFSNTGQSRTRGYEGTFASSGSYDYCDVERESQVYLYNNNGSRDGARQVYDPATGSNRYMPLNGGIHHEAELGLISRGVNHQTLNLTVYNLEEGDNLLRAAYTQQNQDFNNDANSKYYDPVPNGIANGGDREILDHIYITDDARTDGTYSITTEALPAILDRPAVAGGTETYNTPTTTLNNLEQEKKVYGKFNINSLRMHTFKLLFMSMSIPSAANGDYTRPAGLESGILTDNPQAYSIMSRYENADQLRFFKKYTYDNTLPLSATNAPSDPMRWGSKRWGAIFSHDRIQHNYLHTNTTPEPAGRTNDPVTLNDRERETLLLKTKDYITTRYTLYSGVIVGERMLFTRDVNPDPSGFVYVADAIPLSGTTLPAGQVARAGLLGKSLSHKKFRVELAYDHFLDKVIVLDYKYMGKLQ